MKLKKKKKSTHVSLGDPALKFSIKKIIRKKMRTKYDIKIKFYGKKFKINKKIIQNKKYSK